MEVVYRLTILIYQFRRRSTRSDGAEDALVIHQATSIITVTMLQMAGVSETSAISRAGSRDGLLGRVHQ